MKGPEAIAKTKQRLETEFNERKKQRLAGMYKHREELEQKILKLQNEKNTLTNKINEVEQSSFRSDVLSEESRKRQSDFAKLKRN